MQNYEANLVRREEEGVQMVSLLSNVNVMFLPYDSNDHNNSIRDLFTTHYPIGCDYDVLTYHNTMVFHAT